MNSFSPRKTTSSPDAALLSEISRLTEQISTLTAEIASLRAEASANREKAAAVSVSFEAAKDELQQLLQSESGIRAGSLNSPPPPVERDPSAQDESYDNCMLRAVTGQLEVTRASVREATREKEELQQKINSASQYDANRKLRSPLSPSLMHLDIDSLTLSTGYPREDSPAVNQLDATVINRLRAESHLRSSYRDDLARQWRDLTMPNISLIRTPFNDSGGKRDVSCGVVSERIFDGVTAYTSVSADERKVQEEVTLTNASELRDATEDEFKAVVDQYSVVTLEDLACAQNPVKVIAPTAALARVAQLVNKMAPESTTGPIKLTTAGTRRGADNMPAKEKPQKHKIEKQRNGETRPKSTGSSSLKHGPRLSSPSNVLQFEHFTFLMTECVPVRFQECDLQLVYSTNRDGMSVHTLYHRVKNCSPTLVAVRDTRDRVFGCYAASPWKSSAARYYGTGESFVFSGRPKMAAYKWSRKNHFFQFSHGGILAMGGSAGSHFALWIDEDLLMGTTSACSTFDSPPLTNEEGDDTDRVDFKIVALEVWTIVPRSLHLLDNESESSGHKS